MVKPVLFILQTVLAYYSYLASSADYELNGRYIIALPIFCMRPPSVRTVRKIESTGEANSCLLTRSQPTLQVTLYAMGTLCSDKTSAPATYTVLISGG